MAESDMLLESFSFKLDKDIIHLKTCSGKNLYHLFAWYFRKFSSEQTRSTEGFSGTNGSTHSFKRQMYPDRANFTISSDQDWDVAISTHSRTLWFSSQPSAVQSVPSSNKGVVAVRSLIIEQRNFHKIQNSRGVITCRMIRPKAGGILITDICSNTSEKSSEYLKSLDADLKNYSSAFLKEKVNLQVGKETEVANKAVLCAKSSVFTKMFENDAKELENNTFTITDMKMGVLKALLSFLNSGLLPDYDLALLCDLYSAANKYEIRELRQACIRSLLCKTTRGNVVRLLNLSFSNSDLLLMSAIMTLICANIETVALTPDWQDLMRDDPDLALKASVFFDPVGL